MINRVGANTQMISTQQKRTQNVQKQEKLGRVEEIKEQIKNGEYKIDIDKTAEALAKSLL
ncbi:conserved domain protein [Nautilia profundicola AmH]|uniref:Conserved domain protein n=1 Tax=Nautilia profundicola (strain ATCC BAA-1463 / DSM 18972 / AmH) TaxID=598659 RepID=B9L672_NAUPA|nr:flagellar biosynthesis anti-sigma factor FlgM [Nautilia profundicola]ACM93673.1 conserved domain protein [Nautilia profundicola AmH]